MFFHDFCVQERSRRFVGCCGLILSTVAFGAFASQSACGEPPEKSSWVSTEPEKIEKECGEWLLRWSRLSEALSKHSTQFAGQDFPVFAQYNSLVAFAEQFSLISGALMQSESISSQVTELEQRKRTIATILTYYDFVVGRIATQKKYLENLRNVSQYQNIKDDCLALQKEVEEFESKLVVPRVKMWTELQETLGIPSAE